jgi:hypothetical protein
VQDVTTLRKEIVMTFADAINLKVSRKMDELEEIEQYLLTSIVREWKNSWDRITNMSARGNHRLEQYLSDHSITREHMSHDLRNQISWGMICYARSSAQ